MSPVFGSDLFDFRSGRRVLDRPAEVLELIAESVGTSKILGFFCFGTLCHKLFDVIGDFHGFRFECIDVKDSENPVEIPELLKNLCGSLRLQISGGQKGVGGPFQSENGGKRFLAAVPSEKLCVSYVIDYSGTPVGTQNVTYDVTRETFYNIISRARTFGLTSELEYLRRNGLAKGGSLDNALVFDGEGLVGDAALRFPLECVTHKVIDLLGDLTLAGPIPTAHYVAIAAGHSIHGKLARRIRTVFPS